MTDRELLRAFPDTPEECRAALSHAARSVKEEETMKRKYPVAILVAVLLTLMTTIAIAEGWNVLHFLGIETDSDAQTLVQPVSATATAGNVTLTIDSAITDGEYLVFDYTVTNADPMKPVYLNVEQFQANSSGILYSINNETFHSRWLPGWNDDATLQGGCIAPLREWMRQEDVLHVDLVVAVHTAVNPVYRMEAYRWDEAQSKLDEGFVISVGNDKLMHLSDEGNAVGREGGLSQGETIPGMERTTMTLSFDLDMKSALAALKKPDIPEPAVSEHVTLTLERFTVSPLQIRLTAIAAWSDDAPVGLTGKFILRDKDGKTIKLKDVSDSPESYTEMVSRSDRFTNKESIWECAIFAPTPALPDEVFLVLRLTNGTELSLPLDLR